MPNRAKFGISSDAVSKGVLGVRVLIPHDTDSADLQVESLRVSFLRYELTSFQKAGLAILPENVREESRSLHLSSAASLPLVSASTPRTAFFLWASRYAQWIYPFVMLLIFSMVVASGFSFLRRTRILPWLESRGDVSCGLVGCIIILLILFPGIVLFLQNPLAAGTSSLYDPIVSTLTFAPGVGVTSFELFHHQNLLWSNLRGMGMPLLGNETQAAPIFPLTLVFLIVPQPYFWNFVVVGRLLLGGVAAFLIAARFLKFSRWSSLVFTFCLVYCLFVFRWMNHPWQNGFAAGLWYLYFTLTCLGTRRWKPLPVLGLAVSTYSLITCGFPEAAAMSVLLTLLIVPSYLIHCARSKDLTGWMQVSFQLIGGNAAGLFLGSPQLFALVEFVRQAEPYFRSTHGVWQYPDFLPMLYWLTPFTASPPAGPVFGLIPSLLCLLGALKRISRPFQMDWRDGAAFLCLSFYLLKAFPFWSAFNQYFGSLPLLQQSRFPVYFLPILIWVFAFYAATGAEWILDSIRTDNYRNRFFSAAIIGSTTFVLILAAYLCERLMKQSYLSLLFSASGAQSLVLALCLLVFGGIVLFRPWIFRSPSQTSLALICLSGLMLFEITLIHPKRFDFNWVAKDLLLQPTVGKEIADLAEKQGLSTWDVRIWDSGGAYVTRGIATMDDGTMAVLSYRMQRFRNEFFVSDWNGYLPISASRYPYSWDLSGTNLFMAPAGKPVNPLICPHCTFVGNTSRGTSLYWNKAALPRAFLPSQCFVVHDSEESLSQLKARSQLQLGSAIVETDDPEERKLCSQYTGNGIQGPSILEDRGSTLRISEVRGPAIVGLNDNFYPGWKAFDEQTRESLAIRPMNFAFRAIILPQNKSYRIRLEYEPQWLWTSIILAGLAVGAAVLLWIKASLEGRCGFD